MMDDRFLHEARREPRAEFAAGPARTGSPQRRCPAPPSAEKPSTAEADGSCERAERIESANSEKISINERQNIWRALFTEEWFSLPRSGDCVGKLQLNIARRPRVE